MNGRLDLGVMDAAVAALEQVWPGFRPRAGVVLGSGWGAAVSEFAGEELSYGEIPGFGEAGVLGHAGKVRATEIDGMPVLLFQGRRHLYEGEGWTPVVLPVYLLRALGAEHVLLTNASGGIRDDLGPGSLVAVSDHINMLGSNPLIGPHCDALGARFPDQSEVYKKDLREALLRAGADAEGVYVATTGPTFETPAEIRQYRSMGADVVGMSTVPEAIVANAMGMRVAALSCVCNWAAGISPVPLTHDDVNQTAAEAMPRMKQVMSGFLKQLALEA